MSNVKMGNGSVYIYGDLDDHGLLEVVVGLEKFENECIYPIYIHYNLPDIEIKNAWILADTISTIGSEVIGVVDGNCSGAAVIPLLASAKRVMRRHAKINFTHFRLHWNAINEIPRLQEVENYFTEKLGITFDEGKTFFGKYLNAQEALEKGLIHKIW